MTPLGDLASGLEPVDFERSWCQGMVRCIRPLTFDGERYEAGPATTFVQRDQPVVIAHPDRFEPADPSDRATRACHDELLRARCTSSAELYGPANGQRVAQL